MNSVRNKFLLYKTRIKTGIRLFRLYKWTSHKVGIISNILIIRDAFNEEWARKMDQLQ